MSCDSASNVFDCRKRSNLDVDGKHPPHVYGHGAIREEEGVGQTVAIGPS